MGKPVGVVERKSISGEDINTGTRMAEGGGFFYANRANFRELKKGNLTGRNGGGES